MRFLVTGNTGFKGFWLSALLDELGHEVVGISLDPAAGSLFAQTGGGGLFSEDSRVDIRDRIALAEEVKRLKPDFVFHLAAQPLVLDSYNDPLGTLDTNTVGTLNLLSATRGCSSIKGQIIVTTDKVYKNTGSLDGYLETDALGGDDIYSASKAAADILTQAYARSFKTVPTAIARAGNVIGGGDHSNERLIPDIMRSFLQSQALRLRNPDAVRPWQHVLDCVWGYYLLAEDILSEPETHAPISTWNFGPEPEGFVSVSDIVARSNTLLGSSLKIDVLPSPPFAEAKTLTLDSSKARSKLDWQDLLPYPTCLDWTLEWHRAVASGVSEISELRFQIREYLKLVSKPL